jgi:hypothetical protein
MLGESIARGTSELGMDLQADRGHRVMLILKGSYLRKGRQRARQVAMVNEELEGEIKQGVGLQ